MAVVRGLGTGTDVGGWAGVEEVGGFGVVREVLGAVNEGAAVSALGYDYCLSVVGAGVWAGRHGGGWGAGLF